MILTFAKWLKKLLWKFLQLMKIKIRRKVNNVGQWMKMEVLKRILKVGQLIDDLNEIEI